MLLVADVESASDGEAMAWAGGVRRAPGQRRTHRPTVSTVLLLAALSAAVFASGPSIRGAGQSASGGLVAVGSAASVVVLEGEVVPGENATIG